MQACVGVGLNYLLQVRHKTIAAAHRVVTADQLSLVDSANMAIHQKRLRQEATPFVQDDWNRWPGAPPKGFLLLLWL